MRFRGPRGPKGQPDMTCGSGRGGPDERKKRVNPIGSYADSVVRQLSKVWQRIAVVQPQKDPTVLSSRLLRNLSMRSC